MSDKEIVCNLTQEKLDKANVGILSKCPACNKKYYLHKTDVHVKLDAELAKLDAFKAKVDAFKAEENVLKLKLKISNELNSSSSSGGAGKKKSSDEMNEEVRVVKKAMFDYYEVKSGNFFNFFSALVNKEIIKTTKDGLSLWTFEDNTPWLSETYKIVNLLNRPCYDEFINELDQVKEKEKLHFIQGTPGIGKSSFLNRIFLYIIEKFRNNDKSSIVIIYESNIFNQNSKHFVINLSKLNEKLDFHIYSYYRIDYDSMKCDYLLLDTVIPDYPIGKEFSFYVASTIYNTNIIMDFCPLINRYMPIFSFEELCVISPPDWSEEQNRFRYSVLGGCASNFLQVHSDFQKVDVTRNKLINIIKTFTPEDFNDPGNDNYIHYLSIVSIIYRTLKEDNLNSRNLKGFNLFNRTTFHYKTVNINGKNVIVPSWSSDIMRNIIMYYSDKITKTFYNKLENIISNSAFGNVFESLVHYELLSGKKTYEFKYLDNNNNPQYKSVDFSNISGIRYIWNQEGIKDLIDDEYGQPLKQTFEAVDAIIQPNILIQITTREDHPISYQQLQLSRSQLRGPKENHMLIYFIRAPNKGNKTSFKINNLKPPTTRSTNNLIEEEIPQLVGFIETTPDLLKGHTISR